MISTDETRLEWIMKPLSGNNVATLIPTWAQAGPPYAYDAACEKRLQNKCIVKPNGRMV